MSEEQALLAWSKIIRSKQDKGEFRNALAGDGAGNVDVSGEPGYIWCRYSADQSKVSKVFSMVRGVPEDFPIVVGRQFPDDEFERVLAIDWTQYQDIISQDTVDNFNTSNHGESHNAASGVDPAPIDLRNIIEMRGRANDTANLEIDVERGQYIFGYDDVRRFPGETIDLTASVPGVAGHRYVLVYVDGVTNRLDSDDGLIVPLAAAAPIPDLTANTIPICLVDLENGQTTITEDDIYDWRFLWQLVSWNATWLIGTNAERLALAVGDLAELTHFAETDTDQIWQVWEGAWRIVYPPPGLAAPDGSPGTPWTVDNSGNLTGTDNLTLDDGAGDSPLLNFVGGTNDDTAFLYLDDVAGAGDSRLVLALCDTAGDSEFRIADSGGAIKLEFTSDGELTQRYSEALTNTFVTMTTWEHQTSGTAAAGFGIRHLFQLEDGAGNLDDAAAILVDWEDATSGSEDSAIRFYLRESGLILATFLELTATNTIFNNGQADVDFRVETTGATHTLFVDGGLDRVGINESSPSLAKLHVTNNAGNVAGFERSDAATATVNRFYNPDTTDGNLVRLVFSTDTDGAGGAADQGLGQMDVVFVEHDHATRQGRFRFRLSNSGFPADRMIIEPAGDVLIGTSTGPGATNGKTLFFGDNGGDPNPGANTAGFYGKDVAGTVEAFAIDEAGNAAQLTPHNFDGPVQPIPGTLHWSQYHRNAYMGVQKWYDIERALLALETLTGETFIFTEPLDALERRDWYTEQAKQGTRKPMPDWMKGA